MRICNDNGNFGDHRKIWGRSIPTPSASESPGMLLKDAHHWYLWKSTECGQGLLTLVNILSDSYVHQHLRNKKLMNMLSGN